MDEGQARISDKESKFEGTLAEGEITAENLQGERIEKFDAGETYTNVLTKANPGGEVRGQIHK